MARSGKLVFKGEEKAKKKKKAKSSVGSTKIPVAVAGTQEVVGSIDNPSLNNEKHETGDSATATQLPSPSVTTGNGLISTSGTVVTGNGTSFKSDLRIGDAIIAETQRGEEMRIVKMVLSQISISISSAFSSDLKIPTQYKFIVKPRDIKKEKADKARKAMVEKEEVEARAMGTYGNKGEIIYREKTEHGSYRIRREQTNTEMSRSDLLSVRSKKKSDRYC